jgi:capsular polysaccharide biosynthesis protein
MEDDDGDGHEQHRASTGSKKLVQQIADRAARQAATNAVALMVDISTKHLNRNDVEEIADRVSQKLKSELFDIFESIGLSLKPEDRLETTTKLVLIFRMRSGVTWFVRAVLTAFIAGLTTLLGYIFLRHWK